MGELRYDRYLLEEIAHRLDLREPNRKAVESVILRTSDHYDVQESASVYECIVDSATGVGKTYVMAGLIEYLAGTDKPARNFLVLAPGRTIRDKSVRNFTAGARKSLTAAMRSQPLLVTKENFKSPATLTAMQDPGITKVYVFTIQALNDPKSDESRETHEFQEELGGSFYQFLSRVDDLVILADEHHCYRGPAFSRTISELNPKVVVGLTATPDKRDAHLVAYRYPLAAAISDKLVKTPIMVGRRDDRNDDETKLLDGVTLLRYKQQRLRAYCDENQLPTVNPVMLVIAKDIEEAARYQTILDSVAFDNGGWMNKTLLVHSRLTGDAKQKALADLDAVEDSGSPIRIIINVGMLKEGWDVKNVYVIASMRASASEVMTEQTLGRGMRLPFGTYTDIELLDSVEVLAHEKYNELLTRRKALNQAFINFGTYTAARVLPDGKTVVRQETIVTSQPVLGVDGETPNPLPVHTGSPLPPHSSTESHLGDSFIRSGLVDLDTRAKQAAAAVKQTAEKVRFEPLLDRESILIPYIKSTPSAAMVSLNDIDMDRYKAFDQLGATLITDYSDELKRTKIIGRVIGDEATTDTEAASDTLRIAFALDIPLSSSRQSLIQYVMAVPGVQPRALEVGAAERIVDRVVGAMGGNAAVTLSAYLERCGQRLAAAVQKALEETSRAQVTYEDAVKLLNLNKMREAAREPVPGHPDGAFSRSIAFNGWKRNLYSHAWFDTTPEYHAANTIDTGKNVLVWARLHVNDVPITWTAQGRRYNPDFVVIEQDGGRRIGWLVETKGMDRIDSAEVAEKRKAARRWANTVNAAKEVDVEWNYLLVSEQDVLDAQGSWEFLKGFGQ